MWLANLFEDLGYLFYKLYYYTARAAVEIEATLGWPRLVSIFYRIADYFGDAWLRCYDIADELNNWWDAISQHASDIGALWAYVTGWMTDKVNEAVNTASVAISKAKEAINDAAAASQKAIDEAAAALSAAKAYAETLLTDIAGWVQSHGVDIWTAITGLAVDFATWLAGLAVDMWYALTGLAVDFTTWLSELPADIWEAIKGFAADLIATTLIPFAPVLAWYNEVKDNVLIFVQDPWDWLEAKFTDWFLGKE